MNKLTPILLSLILILSIIYYVVRWTTDNLELEYNKGFSSGYEYALEKYGIEE